MKKKKTKQKKNNTQEKNTNKNKETNSTKETNNTKTVNNNTGDMIKHMIIQITIRPKTTTRRNIIKITRNHIIGIMIIRQKTKDEKK